MRESGVGSNGVFPGLNRAYICRGWDDISLFTPLIIHFPLLHDSGIGRADDL